MIEDEESWLSVISEYLPCLDLRMSYYIETLTELERVISVSISFALSLSQATLMLISTILGTTCYLQSK